MKPALSYTIWFTQRTGSTLLCKALEGTGIAGNPQESLLHLLEAPHIEDNVHLQEQLWNSGSTSNGVFGLKYSFCEPHFSRCLELFRTFPGAPQDESNRAGIWESTFPNHRHIFMTRRNKVRLAVSWWKAIQTQEWHRLRDAPQLNSGSTPRKIDHTNGYSFAAINHLYMESAMREAGIEEFFAEGDIAPLTIVYEDFIRNYDETVRTVLDFLGLESQDITIPPPSLAPTADDVSEEWVQRFRKERQEGWVNQGW